MNPAADAAVLNACQDSGAVSAWAKDSAAYVLGAEVLPAKGGSFQPAAPVAADELTAALEQMH